MTVGGALDGGYLPIDNRQVVNHLLTGMAIRFYCPAIDNLSLDRWKSSGTIDDNTSFRTVLHDQGGVYPPVPPPLYDPCTHPIVNSVKKTIFLLLSARTVSPETDTIS